MSWTSSPSSASRNSTKSTPSWVVRASMVSADDIVSGQRALRQSLVVVGGEPHQQELDVEPFLGEQAAALRDVERGRAVEARHGDLGLAVNGGRALRERWRAEWLTIQWPISSGDTPVRIERRLIFVLLWRMTFLPRKVCLPKGTPNVATAPAGLLHRPTLSMSADVNHPATLALSDGRDPLCIRMAFQCLHGT